MQKLRLWKRILEKNFFFQKNYSYLLNITGKLFVLDKNTWNHIITNY